MTVKRRGFLTVVGATALGGCAALEDLQGEEAQYDPQNEEQYVPDEPQPDWEDDDLYGDHEWNEHFQRVWFTEDDRIVIMMNVGVEETIEDAEDRYQKGTQSPKDPKEVDLADEALLWDDGDVAQLGFRDSNAVASVMSMNMSGPDRTRAFTYGDHLLNYMRDQQ